MSDRNALIRAYQADQLLGAIKAALSSEPSEREKLSSDLVDLHNGGAIDLVGTFLGLQRASASGPDFFVLRHVFEKALPELEAPVPEISKCVASLYREAGTDMAAGTILDAFRAYCAQHPDRIRAALAEIEAAPTDLADLLVSVLVEGSKIDPAFYAAESIRLSSHSDLELRRQALFAIGRLEWEANTEDVVAVLEQAAQHEDDDQALACVVKTGSTVLARDPKNESRLVSLVAEALSEGGEVALHAASEVFGFRTSQVSTGLLDLFLEHLSQVNVVNTGTLNNIDYGVAHLLQEKDPSTGLAFVERILLAHPDDLDIGTFDDAARTIQNSPNLRNKVSTRWLLTGEPALCSAVAALVESRQGEACEIEVDAIEIADSEPQQLLFAARKAIGYLFQQPKAPTSFLLSLLRQGSSDSEIQARLEALLWNPLLINFSGKIADYLDGRADSEEEPLKSAIRRSLNALEKYLEDLKAVGEIPALHPSLEHREAYRRHYTGEVAASFKKAQEDSVLLQLFPKSVLLYGRKAVHHVFGPEDEIKRVETQLGAHRTQIEVPRLTVIDPHGLDFLLRVFRSERMVS